MLVEFRFLALVLLEVDDLGFDAFFVWTTFIWCLLADLVVTIVNVDRPNDERRQLRPVGLNSVT